jgi:ABC-type multidrug transport system fused ATPase/permease subunit
MLKARFAFENVSFSYDAQQPALEYIDFTAKPGQIIALVAELIARAAQSASNQKGAKG